MAYRPAAPFSPPMSGSYEERMRQIAGAISKKADQTSEPVYNAVMLIAPNGITYRLSVDDAGSLQVAVLER